MTNRGGMDAKSSLLTFFVFSSVFAKPTRIPPQDFRSFVKPMTISMDKSSPAYAALEDCQTDYILSDSSIDKAEGISEIVSEVLVIGRFDEQPNSNQQVIHLNGQTISTGTKKDYLADLIKGQRGRAMPLTYQEVARTLVNEELERRAEASEHEKMNSGHVISRVIPTASGSEIKINKVVQVVDNISSASGSLVVSSAGANSSGRQTSGHVAAANGVNPYRGQNFNSSSHPKPSPKTNLARRANNSTEQTIAAVPNQDMMGSLAEQKAQNEDVTIRGTITFLDGAALTGRRDQLITAQIVDGLVVSTGAVNLNDATYSISVPRLEGIIETQVRSADGHLTAIGRTNLYDLALHKPSRAQIRNIALTVRPVSSGVSANIISAASYGKKLYPLKNAKLFIADINRQIIRNKESDRFEDRSVLIPSQFVLRAQHQKFWPTITVAESGEETQIKMFPDSLVNALLDLTLDKYAAREAALRGVVWGRVAFEGRPVSGARVKLISDLDKRATYFNGFLPDPSQNHTLASGDYAFSNIDPGEKLIQVQLGSKTFWPTMIPVENKTVSHADLIIQKEKTIKIESFDAFDQSPLQAILQPLGTDQQILIPEGGQIQHQVQTVRGNTYIESDPGEPYVVTRTQLAADQTELYFPQIKSEWLAKFRGDKKPYVSLPPTQTVGFVYGDNFEVVVGNGSAANIKVVYFDSQGQEVKDHGVAGGGYIVYDLFPGRRSITVIPEKSKNIITKSIYVDHVATTVMRMNILF